jgi:outer membrane receptor protein involved in Fe transport
VQDRNNFGPRLGFAYSVTPGTVVRGGYGTSYMHFQRAGSGNILAINGPQVVNVLDSQLDPVALTFRTTQQGYPGATDPTRFNQLTANVTYMPRDYRSSRVDSWFVSVQRELFARTIVDVAMSATGRAGCRCSPTTIRRWPNRPADYFNRAAVQIPDPSQPFGNASRNTVRGPNFWQVDLALQKRVRLPFVAHTSVDVRAEAFNLLNRTNLRAPSGNASSNAFGTITSAFDARQIQLGVRLNFWPGGRYPRTEAIYRAIGLAFEANLCHFLLQNIDA